MRTINCFAVCFFKCLSSQLLHQTLALHVTTGRSEFYWCGSLTKRHLAVKWRLKISTCHFVSKRNYSFGDRGSFVRMKHVNLLSIHVAELFCMCYLNRITTICFNQKFWTPCKRKPSFLSSHTPPPPPPPSTHKNTALICFVDLTIVTRYFVLQSTSVNVMSYEVNLSVHQFTVRVYYRNICTVQESCYEYVSCPHFCELYISL
jgi:hypothetical protein